MTRNEFLSKLSAELNKNKVIDSADIISEYEQHFNFKLADGFSEEEIAAKLGNPTSLACLFESGSATQKCGARKAITVTGLCFADVVAGLFFALLIAWGVIMVVFSLTCAVAAVCLFGGINIYSLIPHMPYWCAAAYGMAMAALAVLTAAGCIYFAAFVRQLMHSFGRFHHNVIASSSGSAVLPPLAIKPQVTAKTNRRIRSIALISLALFAAFFVLGIILSMLSSGALEFWHAWGWFGYTGN